MSEYFYYDDDEYDSVRYAEEQRRRIQKTTLEQFNRG